MDPAGQSGRPGDLHAAWLRAVASLDRTAARSAAERGWSLLAQHGRDADLGRRAHAADVVHDLDHRCQRPDVVAVAAWVSPASLPIPVSSGDGSLRIAVEALAALSTTGAEEVRRLLDDLARDPARAQGDAAVLSDVLLEPVGAGADAYRAWKAVLLADPRVGESGWPAVRRALLDRDNLYVSPELRGRIEGAALLHLARDGAAYDAATPSRPA